MVLQIGIVNLVTRNILYLNKLFRGKLKIGLVKYRTHKKGISNVTNRIPKTPHFQGNFWQMLETRKNSMYREFRKFCPISFGSTYW